MIFLKNNRLGRKKFTLANEEVLLKRKKRKLSNDLYILKFINKLFKKTQEFIKKIINNLFVKITIYHQMNKFLIGFSTLLAVGIGARFVYNKRK
jgi:hypothetical protein